MKLAKSDNEEVHCIGAFSKNLQLQLS